jgi:hypothetical protein
MKRKIEESMKAKGYAAKNQAPAATVKMQDASGKTFNIPADKAAEAEADGLKRI